MSSVLTVPVADLRSAPYNPRRVRDAEKDRELLASIEAYGILTPLLVRQLPDDVDRFVFEVIAGHRRLEAAREAGLLDVPVTVVDLNDAIAHDVAIVENLQRDDLAPLDEAQAFGALVERGQTPEQIAANVGKSTAYIGRRLRLLRLTPEAQGHLQSGALDMAHAELLMKLTAEQQAEAMKEECWFSDGFMRDEREDDEDDDVEPSDGDEYEYDRCTPAAANLKPLSYLKDWITNKVKLDLSDRDTLSLFPAAARALQDAAVEADTLQPVEIARGHYGGDVPAGVLSERQYRDASAQACASTVTGIVVFGRSRGKVLPICRDSKCPIHCPMTPATRPRAVDRDADESDEQDGGAATVPDWQREHQIYERIAPRVRRALFEEFKTRPFERLLEEIAGEKDGYGCDPTLAEEVIGPLTLQTLGAWFLANNRVAHTLSAARQLCSEFEVAIDLDALVAEAEAELFPPTPKPAAKTGKAKTKKAR